jgi:putative membrane protein
MTAGEVLPAVNASLNAASAVLLVLGFVAIRRGRVRRHRRLMLSALACSVAFLAGYLTRVALTGMHRFPGSGALRAAYLGVLASHTVFAAAAAPLVVATVVLALRARFRSHRRVARATLPIWLYVSVTGVAVYVLLYQVGPFLR